MKEEPEEIPKEKVSEDVEKIRRNGRICLKNLVHCCTEDNLRELIGDVSTKELRCLVDFKTGECKGIGYIQFVDKNDAVKVYETFNKTEFMVSVAFLMIFIFCFLG